MVHIYGCDYFFVFKFYKKLFGYQDKIDITLEDDFWGDDSKVTSAHYDILNTPFIEQEIKEAVFGSYAEGAPGHMGFLSCFTKNTGS